ncbi:SCO6745 family protein [Nocardia tengchongensis]|uniref:SCO6745 family protein n=1 Tax=Nocardia tengchongensis TaxID=2055889 RepID=UPI0036AA2C57
MDNAFARDLWRVLEPLHAITYFAADCRAANKAVGLRGYWMGYFAARSAPFGAVGPSVVEATFYGFHPAMVRRAIPDAWTYATPEAVIATRTIAAAAVLRTIVPDIATVAARTVPHLQRAIEAAPAGGRALFAANRDLPTPGDAVHALWQAVTALREHRGDGHVACLLSEGIDGCEAHVLFSAANGFPVQIMRDNRGWTETDWQAAHERLTARGLLDADGITAAGRALREHIEARTDALAMTAYRDVPGMVETLAVLTPAARAVARSGEVPYPNPMGADPA